MATLLTPTSCCPFPECPSNSGRSSARVVAHSRLKTRTGWRRRRRCRVCERTFTHTTGTVYHRLRRSKADFDRAVQMQSEGMTKAAIARVLGVSPSTVYRWLEKAGEHARVFHEAHARLADPVEVQFDELSCNGVGQASTAWAYSAIEVWSRFWVSLFVGNRTLRSTLLFVRRLKATLVGATWRLIAVSDGFKYYEAVMRRVFPGTLVYLQVDNRYSSRGIVRSDVRQVLGTPLALEYAWERSEDSRRPNTSFVERINLRKRMCCSFLRRRNPAPARKPEKIEQALDLVRVIYNFVRRHSSLRFGRVMRTPAMQAGLFSRPLTIREIFLWIPPPSALDRWRLGQRLEKGRR